MSETAIQPITVSTPAIPVLRATRYRLNARFGMALFLAVGGMVTGLPEILPTLNQIFPAHAKQLGWACILIGWVWNAGQRGAETLPGHTHDVNFSGPMSDPDKLLDVALSMPVKDEGKE